MERILIAFILICWTWYGGIKPLMGEIESMRHRTAKDIVKAEEHIERAVSLSPLSTEYMHDAAMIHLKQMKYIEGERYLEKAIISNNGDFVPWGLWAVKGGLEAKRGNLYHAKSSYEKALWYFPMFKPAKQAYEKVCGITEKHEESIRL